ncbi:hypothetical protein [Streptomyces sp. NPDC048603]|uniref:hypothetical protein n=1 Tax=Streptomyces sp. NPDC048603 TaxID=3365577 RepID=UPI00372167E2
MEILLALIAAVATVAAAVVPVLLVHRRTRGAVATEGAATREALDGLKESVHQRIDDIRDDLRGDIGTVREDLRNDVDTMRTDLGGVREDVARIREWQAGHDAEHLLIGRQPPPGGDT